MKACKQEDNQASLFASFNLVCLIYISVHMYSPWTGRFDFPPLKLMIRYL